MHIDISVIDKYGINKRERFYLYDEGCHYILNYDTDEGIANEHWHPDDTAEALELPEAVFEMAKEMIAGQQFTIGTIDVMPFGTFHDAEF